jgi:hypothetical protein
MSRLVGPSRRRRSWGAARWRREREGSMCGCGLGSRRNFEARVRKRRRLQSAVLRPLLLAAREPGPGGGRTYVSRARQGVNTRAISSTPFHLAASSNLTQEVGNCTSTWPEKNINKRHETHCFTYVVLCQ